VSSSASARAGTWRKSPTTAWIPGSGSGSCASGCLP
jgi:hypothetical protein